MPIDDITDFAALDPFFRIIRQGLVGLVYGEHFFDLLAEDVVFEYVISVPGYPRRVQGRRAVADLYRGYGDIMVLHSADELAVHRDPETSVVVLEYAVHGQAVHTWRAGQGPPGDALAGLPGPRSRLPGHRMAGAGSLEEEEFEPADEPDAPRPQSVVQAAERWVTGRRRRLASVTAGGA